MNKIWDLEEHNENIAMIDDMGDVLSYASLTMECEKLGQNIDHRCLVFVLSKNSIGSVLGYISFLNNGIVPVMLSSNLEKELLNIMVEAYHPSFMWIPESQEKDFQWKCVYKSQGYALLRCEVEREYPLYEDLALLLTTSGSTGSPKFVRQSYANIKANMVSILEYLYLDSTERAITTLPMNYTYGLSIINTHLAVGATILLTEKGLMQKEFWTFFRDKEATSFGGVPYTYEMLDKLRFYRMKLPSLRTMTQAGGKLTPELHEKFAKYAAANNKKFVVMYGQCEATARMGYLPPEVAVEKKGSMGIAIPGGKFHLIDVDGKDITQPFVPGELVYEGENVTLGYAEQGEDLVRGDERQGILVTGDMAQFDEDGYYYIVGRKKRFLKIYGNRVNLDEMDRMIKGKFEIDVACAGVDDHMYIFLTDDAYSEKVREYVVEKTGLNHAAFNIRVINEIPKNDSGKTQYTKLKEYYE